MDDLERWKSGAAELVGTAMRKLGAAERAGDRLYRALALLDTRDGSPIADVVRAAREGWERDHMGEAGAWDELDSLLSAASGNTETVPMVPAVVAMGLIALAKNQVSIACRALADIVNGWGVPQAVKERAADALEEIGRCENGPAAGNTETETEATGG